MATRSASAVPQLGELLRYWRQERAKSQLHRGDDRFAYFSLITTVGTPQYITAQELRVECMFPIRADLIFPQMDQINFMGPFEVLSRMPDATVQIWRKNLLLFARCRGFSCS